VHEPTYRDDRLAAISTMLEGMLERDVPPVSASFRDGAGNAWDEVLVLFVSNNAYPPTDFGGRPRLDAGLLEVTALRHAEGQELGRALENLWGGRADAGRAGRTGRPRASRSTRRTAGWRSASTARRWCSAPRSSSGSTLARCACWSPRPGPSPDDRRAPPPRRAAGRWGSPPPVKVASSRSPRWCGWAACSAGSASASSGPGSTGKAGRCARGGGAAPASADRAPTGSRRPSVTG
jgi:hypothetical protein